MEGHWRALRRISTAFFSLRDSLGACLLLDWDRESGRGKLKGYSHHSSPHTGWKWVNQKYLETTQSQRIGSPDHGPPNDNVRRRQSCVSTTWPICATAQMCTRAQERTHVWAHAHTHSAWRWRMATPFQYWHLPLWSLILSLGCCLLPRLQTMVGDPSAGSQRAWGRRSFHPRVGQVILEMILIWWQGQTAALGAASGGSFPQHNRAVVASLPAITQASYPHTSLSPGTLSPQRNPAGGGLQPPG